MEFDDESLNLGYNRNHRQTAGGVRAYNRGELPLSYWTKKHLLNDLTVALKSFFTDEQFRLPIGTILEEISKWKFDRLKKVFLGYSGQHLTGNYYRHTDFYGILNKEQLQEELMKYYALPTPKKKELVQLKIWVMKGK